MGWLEVLSDAAFAFARSGIVPVRFWRAAPGELLDQHMSRNHAALALSLDDAVYGNDRALQDRLVAEYRAPMGQEGEPLAGYMQHWLLAAEVSRRFSRSERVRRAASDFIAACIAWADAHMTPEGPLVTGGRTYNPKDDPETEGYDEDACLHAYVAWASPRGVSPEELKKFMSKGERERWEAGRPDKPWRALYVMSQVPRPYRPQRHSLHKLRTISPYVYVVGDISFVDEEEHTEEFAAFWRLGLPGVPSHMVVAVSYVGGRRHVARPSIPVLPSHKDRPDEFYVKAISVTAELTGKHVECDAVISPVNKKLQRIGDWQHWSARIPRPKKTLAIFETSQHQELRRIL